MIVVILAGGEGRRIGGGKPRRLLGGEALIDRAVRIARGWSGDVHVAGEAPIGVPMIRDDPAIEGPLGGVAAALRLGRDLLTIPCDMPFLPDDLALRLGNGAQAATIAESGGRLHPVCALWRARSALGLGDYVASGGRSLRGFAEAVGYEAVAWGAAPIDPFFNINDEEDLARAEALLRNR
jgi:molybdopterin-guanine dinucleotide biosynthesis protein A